MKGIPFGIETHQHPDSLWGMLDMQTPESKFKEWGFARVEPTKVDGYQKYMVSKDGQRWFYAHTDRTSAYVSQMRTYETENFKIAWYMHEYDNTLSAYENAQDVVEKLNKQLNDQYDVIFKMLHVV